jgi:hypothetical protein
MDGKSSHQHLALAFDGVVADVSSAQVLGNGGQI